jgi:ParB family transcriptional regulator, chromosome partitioning protein
MTVTPLHPTEPVDAPVDLVLIDPGVLVLDVNVRTDLQVDKSFVASVKDLGVLVPIVAHRASDGLRVLYGQRRTVAAVEAELRQVPVYVVDVPDGDTAREVWRIVAQLAENDDRSGLRAVERVAAHQQLSLLGLSATAIARRTHRKVKDVRSSLAVAGSELATAAMDRFDLTLEQAAVLAEFDGDTAAVKALTVTARQNPGQFEHTAQRLRDKRALDAARTAVVQELTAAGVPVVEQAFGDRSVAKLTQLSGPDGDGEMTVEAHAGCPGHAAYLRDGGSWDGPPEVTPVYVCADWRKQGHRHRDGEPITGIDAAASGRMSEEQKIQRKAVIANNRAWDAAKPVRRKWLTEFLSRRSAPKDAPRWVTAMLANCSHEVRKAMEDSHGTALTLLGLQTDPQWRPYNGSEHPVAVAAATATPARAGMLTLGLLLGGLEGGLNRNTWRYATSTDKAYFRALRTWGYALAEVELLVLGGAEPITADSDPTGDADASAIQELEGGFIQAESEDGSIQPEDQRGTADEDGSTGDA